MQMIADGRTTAKLPPNGARGELILPPQWFGLLPEIKGQRLIGGPFRNMPDGYFGICLLEHFAGEWDGLHMPIRDFGVPTNTRLVEAALLEAFNALLSGKKVWVGCAGAYGRTGLFLGLMAKVAGVADPIEYVRDIYCGAAIETEQQEVYIKNFDVSFVRSTLFWHRAWFRWFGGKLV
jgi:hypothetical protein